MKALLLSAFIIALFFNSCSSNSLASQYRGVYLLLSPTKERIAHKEKLEQMLLFLVHDMSPGDTLVVDMPNNKTLQAHFSTDPAIAFKEKRALKKALFSELKRLKPVSSCLVNDVFSRAQKFLSQKVLKNKAILLCSTSAALSKFPSDLENTTVSVLTLIEKSTADTQKIKRHVEAADGRFVLASNFNELTQVLKYR